LKKGKLESLIGLSMLGGMFPGGFGMMSPFSIGTMSPFGFGMGGGLLDLLMLETPLTKLDSRYVKITSENVDRKLAAIKKSEEIIHDCDYCPAIVLGQCNGEKWFKEDIARVKRRAEAFKLGEDEFKKVLTEIVEEQEKESGTTCTFLVLKRNPEMEWEIPNGKEKLFEFLKTNKCEDCEIQMHCQFKVYVDNKLSALSKKSMLDALNIVFETLLERKNSDSQTTPASTDSQTPPDTKTPPTDSQTPTTETKQ